MIIISYCYLVFTIPSNQKKVVEGGHGRSRGRGSRGNGRGSRGNGRGRGVKSCKSSIPITIINEDEKNAIQILSDDDFEATSE
jgi:hypothetical protein